MNNSSILATILRLLLTAAGGGLLTKALGSQGADAVLTFLVSAILLAGPAVWAIIVKKIAATRNENIQTALNSLSQAVATVTPLVEADGNIGPVTEAAAKAITDAAIAQLSAKVNAQGK